MPADDFTDRQLGEFVVEERIGQGAMAVVYRAFQPSVNRQVALKVIHLDTALGGTEEFHKRFAREAEVVAQLEHIHIQPIYNYGISGDVAYLAMRFLRGGTLADLLDEGPLPVERAAEIFDQIASGLAYAHSKGVIHRDLKPSNIMFDDSGNTYLTDFGLARLIEGTSGLTKEGHVVGTPAYMSPEQLRGESLDRRSDIYSLGVVLFHMLVGKPPFDVSGTDVVALMYKHLEQTPVPPSELRPELPAEVDAVVLQAMQKRPAERFDNALQMADALNAAIGRQTTRYASSRKASALPTMSASATQRQVAARSGSLRILGVLALLVAVGLVAVLASGVLRRPAGFTAATVLEGEQGVAADAVPTIEEIALARERLGANGFVAYVTCTQDTQYHATQAREMGDFARAFGLAYRVYDSAADDYRQITQIERARADGATALILCPLNPSLLDGTLRSVQEAQMPLVVLGSNMPSYGGVLISSDEYLLGLLPGQLAGQIIAQEMDGKANVIILDYPSIDYLVTRADGLQDGVLEFAPEATIVGRYLGGIPDNGREQVSQLIEDAVEFNVIVSINDAGAFGAIEAMEDAGFEPDSVVIASVDAEQRALQYIRDGYFMRGSVEVDREGFSHTALNTIVKLLAGATLPESLLVPPGEVVTKEVLEERGQG